MCLESKAEFEACKVGYKVLELYNKRLYNIYRGNDTELLTNKWLDEKDYRNACYKRYRLIHDIVNSEPMNYRFGFHIYHLKKDAMEMAGGDPDRVVVKVEVALPVQTGYQYNRKVTVARMMKIVRVYGRGGARVS